LYSWHENPSSSILICFIYLARNWVKIRSWNELCNFSVLNLENKSQKSVRKNIFFKNPKNNLPQFSIIKPNIIYAIPRWPLKPVENVIAIYPQKMINHWQTSIFTYDWKNHPHKSHIYFISLSPTPQSLIFVIYKICFTARVYVMCWNHIKCPFVISTTFLCSVVHWNAHAKSFDFKFPSLLPSITFDFHWHVCLWIKCEMITNITISAKS
jgi:hypothetical protein